MAPPSTPLSTTPHTRGTDARSAPPRPVPSHRARRERTRWRAGLPFVALILLLPTGAHAQALGQANQANWELAERFSSDNLERFVHSTSVQSNWIHESDSLWYRYADAAGTRYELVLPSGPTRRPLFDHDRMAWLLSEELETYLEPHDLDLDDVEFAEDGGSFEFVADSVRFRYDLDAGALENLGPEEEDEEEEEREWRTYSPDSTAYVFAEEHDLYFVEIVDGEEGDPVRLTEDGEEDYSFGSRDEDEDDDDDEEDDDDDEEEEEQEEEEEDDPTERRVRARVEWSEDSRAFSVTRSDRRHVDKLYLVDVLAEPRPELEEYRYSMPGEEKVPQVELHVFDRDDVSLEQVPVERFKDQRIMNIHWTNGGSDHLRLVRRARSQRYLELVEIERATGDIRVLLTEATDKGHLRQDSPEYLDEDNSGDFLWYSRRTGWAHYYRYDHDGNLRNAVTSGSWNVDDIEEVDEESDRIWFSAVGREPGENVNYQHLYRVEADGSGLVLLDEGDANHNTSLSPNQRFILDNYSRVDQAPRSVLRDADGNVVLELEEMDLSELEEFGWMMPETFVTKAADGVTDIYGNMWKPFDFDPERRYPVIAYVYPGPQTESVTTGFRATPTEQELAQLGFLVIQIGNRGGTPSRSAAYHSYGYFNLRDYGLADKKAGIEELAKRHAFVDASRVGIYGHSGGGFMTAAALLVPPYNDFFTVGVSSAGNHDNNVYNQNWSEQHHGLEVTCQPPDAAAISSSDQGESPLDGADGSDGSNGSDNVEAGRRVARVVAHEGHCEADEDVEFEIHVPANHEVAENLKGRLLLVHGDMDNNVHHAGTMRLVRELIRNGKRFDFMMFPGMRHGFGGQYNDYWAQVRAEYFARHLLGDDYRSAEIEEKR